MEKLIEFRNRAGHLLRGMVHLPRGATARKPAPGVVFFHGFTGDRMESHWLFVKCARSLAEAGVASLRFDFYGSGESEGEFCEVTLQGEIADARDAVNYFRRQKGIDPRRLGLLGLSMGGAIAACLAAGVRARAMVLWSALAHPQELRGLAERNTRPLPGAKGLHEYGGHQVSERFLEGLDGVEPLREIARFKGPTLILHPENDEHLPLHHPEDLYRHSAAREKEKVIIPGADHVFTSVAWEREVIAHTVEWFRRHLVGIS